MQVIPVDPASPQTSAQVNPQLSFQESQTFEMKGVKQSIEAIQTLNKRIQGDGYSRISFFIGILNIIMTVFVITVYPEYYWIVFLVKFAILLPSRLYVGHKRAENYYLFDFCWYSVTLVFICFILTAIKAFDAEMTRQAMRILFTFSCGTQGWSIIIFSNSLVFHSLMHTCSIFIHLSPVLLCYTIRWNLQELNDAFPDFFPIDKSMITDDIFGDLYFPAFCTYLVWFVLYTSWLCLHGLGLPAKGQDTIINWLYTTKKPFQKILDTVAHFLCNQKDNQLSKAKVFIFMAMHMCMVTVTMLWGLLCYKYEGVHIGFIFLLCVCAIWRASSFYMYFQISAPQKELFKLLKKMELKLEEELDKDRVITVQKHNKDDTEKID